MAVFRVEGDMSEIIMSMLMGDPFQGADVAFGV